MSCRLLGMPDGWFPVAYSDELAIGACRRVRYFDRTFTLLRNDDGSAAMREDSDGRSGALATTWPVAERNGFVLAWHHAERRSPDFDIPVFDEWGAADWTTRYLRRSWRVRAHAQQVVENAVDWEHLSAVHGTTIPKEKAERFEGKVMRWAIGGNRYVPPLEAPRDDSLVHAESWGLGFSWLRYNGMFTTVVATGVTPIDRQSIDIRLGVLGKRDGRTEAATNEGLEAYLDGQAAAVERDVAIWERARAKHEQQAAPHVDGDHDDAFGEGRGIIAELRRWARQFYSGDAAAIADSASDSR